MRIKFIIYIEWFCAHFWMTIQHQYNIKIVSLVNAYHTILFDNMKILLGENSHTANERASEQMIIHAMPMAIETMMRRHVHSLFTLLCITFSHNSFVSICKWDPMLLFTLFLVLLFTFLTNARSVSCHIFILKAPSLTPCIRIQSRN